MKEKLWNFVKQPKNWIILALIILLGLVGLFGGKTVTKYREEVTVLKSDKNHLELQIKLRNDQIKVEKAKGEAKQDVIDSCMKVFKAKDAKIARQEGKLSEALAQLEGIKGDSSYIFLTQIAYNYPGVLKYLFNEYQVKAIHGDYLRARSAEIVIPELKEQVNLCKFQFSVRDSLVKHLNTVVSLQDQNLKDCAQINADNDKIIKDQDKTIAKERRRKNFWRVVSAVEPGIAVVALVIIGIM